MLIREKIPISSLTTMRLGGEADFVISVTSVEDVRSAYEFAKEKGLPVWVMGGGANTLARDEGFRGVIILNELKGLEIIEENDKGMILRGMGGEKWDDVVEFACKQGYSGIEALSLIPGTLGAAPVQNIGAYGQDIGQVLVSVDTYDTKTREFVMLDKSEMDLGYRRTRFNHGKDAGRFFITAVTLRLKKEKLQPPLYNSLQRYLDEHGITDYSPMNIREAVCNIRNEKLPDPEKVASAGSFFKNIYLDEAEVKSAKAKKIPVWENPDGSGKINSGWLIEECELKGKELFGFRISDKASLVLINESAKSYADLENARAEIIKTVQEKFGYKLEQEPVEIPVE